MYRSLLAFRFNHQGMKSSFSTFWSSILDLLHACKRRAKEWAQYNISFCKPVFFIAGLIVSHAFVDTAVISIFISYIIDEWKHKSLPVAAAIVNVQEGISTIFRVIVVHIADAYVGRFKIVACTTSLYILGLVLLIFVHQPGSFGLFASLLITVGIAGRGPTLKAFLSDHVIKPTEANTNNVDNKEKVEARTNLWWRVAWFLGAAIGVIISSLYNSKIVFIVSAGVMGVAYVLFWSGIFFYHPRTPTGSPLSIVYRVVTVAVLKRHLSYPTDSNEVLLFPHNPLFRFLDKAAIPETSNPDQERQQGRLCTKEEVNRVKKLLALLPMWTSLLVYAVAKATGSTFFIEQSDGFDDTLTINAFPILASLVSFIVSYLFSALIPKRWKENKEKRELVTLWRIGLGMVCSILCCVTASKVEVRRQSHKKIKMSNLWLFPQFTLLGVMEGLARDGLTEFFYSQVDESMKHYESSLNDCMLGIGNFLSVMCVFACKTWIGDDVNNSRLDKYYLMLAALSCGNLCFYVLVALAYARKEAPLQDEEMDEVDIELGGAEYVTRSTSTNPAITNIMMDNKNLRSRSLEVKGYSSDVNNKKLLFRFRTFK